MDENSAALSQDAIDELVDTQSKPDDQADTETVTTEEPQSEASTDEVDAESGESPEDTLDDEPASPEPDPVPPEPSSVITMKGPEPLDIPDAVEPEPLTVDAPPPPGVTPPPGVVHEASNSGQFEEDVIDEEHAMQLADTAVNAAIAPVKSDIGKLATRMGTLEAALKKIAMLEAEVSRLKSQQKAALSGVSVDDLKPLVERLMKLEKAAKGSPVFNLYEKFTCASCESHGAAQVRSRCGSCGKEGWFGRKNAA